MELVGIEKLTDLIKIINESENITIVSHEDPDGDAIGSALALNSYLKEYFEYNKIEKSVQVVLKRVPERYNILKGFDEIKEDVDGDIDIDIDLLIVLDLNEKKRLGELEFLIDKARKILVIDHHFSEPNLGDYKVFNKNSAATGLLLANIYNEIKDVLNLPQPSKESIECALAAVIADTSGFRNSNTNKEVLEFTIKVMEHNIDVNTMFSKVLNKNKNELALNNLVLNRLEYFFDDRIAFSYLLLSDDAYKNRGHGEHEGFSNILRDIEGVAVGILVRETDEGFKVSIRSKKETNCRIIAEAFGGGGHENASGITFRYKDIEKIKNEVIEKTIEVLKGNI